MGLNYAESKIDIGQVTKSIGIMLLENRELFKDKPAFAEKYRQNNKSEPSYRYFTWGELTDAVLGFAAYLNHRNIPNDGKVAFITSNSYHRLITELAVMASGRISVPIFFGYQSELMGQLLDFTEPDMLIIENPEKLSTLPTELLPKEIVTLNGEFKDLIPRKHVISCKELYENYQSELIGGRDEVITQINGVDPNDIAIIMFTSGTTSFPKGVMLSHYNILSQQAALKVLWKPQTGMRFLCYLPWHHSFGGLFERFFALCTGGSIAIDDSAGKNIDKLLANFAAVKPHVYFSVPKIYQEIIGRTLVNAETMKVFFHPDLQFVFTAAAPLPASISDQFAAKSVTVIEGWGLTETSPCCTLTSGNVKRKPGIVGFPIPGVQIKIAENGEILVRGPNVMKGYYLQEGTTAKVLDQDGWFKTGDLGDLSEDGLKIISRVDRVFKLSNGEKVYPATLEENIGKKCPLVKHAYVFGSGKEYPCALLFPNFELLSEKTKHGTLGESGCQCPANTKEFSNCFGICLKIINDLHGVKFEQISKALLINHELSIEKNELTPSFKLIPRNIEKNYAPYIQCLMSDNFDQLPEDAVVIS